MIYYLIVATFPLLVNFFQTNINRGNRIKFKDSKKSLGYIIIAILPMFLLYVLRYKQVGPDTIQYVNGFYNAKHLSFIEVINSKERTELGFRLYEKLISSITNNYTVYFLINGLILFLPIIHFAKNHTGNPYIFLFMFCALGSYNFYMTGLRQSLAISICLLSVDFIKNKKPIRFIFIVLLAFAFHKSAIFFIVAYPLSHLKINSVTVFIYVCLSVVLMFTFNNFQEAINEWLNYDYTIEETGNGQIFFILIVLLFIYTLINHKEIFTLTNPQPYGIIFNMSIVTVILWALRLLSRTAERPGYYFLTFLYALVSWGFCTQKNVKDNFIYRVLVLGVCGALFAYRILGTSYRFFWM